MCVISTWFGDISCSRRDLYVLQKVTITLFQILFVAAFYAKTNVTSRAWKSALNINALATGHRHSARRKRIAPFDLRRASLPVAALYLYCLLILCVQRSGTIFRTQGVVFIRVRGPRFFALVDIPLVTINRQARCTL